MVAGLARGALSHAHDRQAARAHLERMGLADPGDIKARLQARIVTAALRRAGQLPGSSARS